MKQQKSILDRKYFEEFRNPWRAVQEVKLYKHTDCRWTFLQINGELSISTGYQHLHWDAEVDNYVCSRKHSWQCSYDTSQRTYRNASLTYTQREWSAVLDNVVVRSTDSLICLSLPVSHFPKDTHHHLPLGCEQRIKQNAPFSVILWLFFPSQAQTHMTNTWLFYTPVYDPGVFLLPKAAVYLPMLIADVSQRKHTVWVSTLVSTLIILYINKKVIPGIKHRLRGQKVNTSPCCLHAPWRWFNKEEVHTCLLFWLPLVNVLHWAQM